SKPVEVNKAELEKESINAKVLSTMIYDIALEK
ncbi:hypothetical protein, partial [Staphylococcus aureus]